LGPIIGTVWAVNGPRAVDGPTIGSGGPVATTIVKQKKQKIFFIHLKILFIRGVSQ